MTVTAPTSPAPPPTSPAGSRPTSATRHLNVASYIDEDFCRRSLDEVYHQPRRVVAPSFAFDLATVLAHCRRARRIVLVRDAILIGVVILTACWSPLGLVIGLLTLSGIYTARSGFQVLAEITKQFRDGAAKPFALFVKLLTFSLGLIALNITALVLLPLVTVAGLAISSDPTTLLGLAAVGSLVSIVGLCGPPVATALIRWNQATKHGPGQPAMPMATDPRLDAIRVEQAGNATVYSGYSPFIGSGSHIDTSGFALRLIQAPRDFGDRTDEDSREYTELPFSAAELITHVRARLGQLVVATEPERRLPGLTVTDRIFVAGNEVSQLATHINPAYLPAIIANPVDAARHYLACQVSSWDGELVTSVYVHFALQGKSLYVETVTYALTPCDEEYRIVDDVRSLGPVPYLKVGWKGLLNAPLEVSRAPWNLVSAGVRAVIRAVQPTTTAQIRRGYDYGASVSIREDAADGGVRNDFQMQDVEKYRKIIVRRALAATLDFLVMKGVDSAEFRQRSNVMINSGLYVGAGAQVGDIGNITGSFNSDALTKG